FYIYPEAVPPCPPPTPPTSPQSPRLRAVGTSARAPPPGCVSCGSPPANSPPCSGPRAPSGSSTVTPTTVARYSVALATWPTPRATLPSTAPRGASCSSTRPGGRSAYSPAEGQVLPSHRQWYTLEVQHGGKPPGESLRRTP